MDNSQLTELSYQLAYIAEDLETERENLELLRALDAKVARLEAHVRRRERLRAALKRPTLGVLPWLVGLPNLVGKWTRQVATASGHIATYVQTGSSAGFSGMPVFSSPVLANVAASISAAPSAIMAAVPATVIAKVPNVAQGAPRILHAARHLATPAVHLASLITAVALSSSAPPATLSIPEPTVTAAPAIVATPASTTSPTDESLSTAPTLVAPSAPPNTAEALLTPLATLPAPPAPAMPSTNANSFATSVPITQVTPTTAPSVTTTASAAYTDQLKVSGTTGPITYVETLTPPHQSLLVSASGSISTVGRLAAGTYKLSGTDSDAYGDTGTWSYTLTVTPSPIAQSGSMSASVTTAESKAFSDQLSTTGANGATTYEESPGSQIVVASNGAVLTNGTLAAGTYTASGKDSDAYGDTGTWSYKLTVNAVTILQDTTAAPTTAVDRSCLFTSQMTVTGATGSVTFAEAAGTQILVSSSGAVWTSAMLAVGTYTASGTDSDAYGDTGTWSYTLTVTPSPIAQSGSMSASVTTAESKAFSDQLSTTGANGATTYEESPGSQIVVASNGAVLTNGTLAAGTYTASGKDSDAYGDTGTWSYKLILTAPPVAANPPSPVPPPPILQTPSAGSVAMSASATFADRLALAGGTGPLTFTQTTRSGLSLTGANAVGPIVSSTGTVTTSGPLLPGTYEVTGTVSDAAGDTAAWTYTLIVTAG